MASDRSRLTYDEAQRYRRVVIQQGKPILDADIDEAQEILSEGLRQDALDIIGPSGTPDDGYKITPAASNDVNVGPGTMYVGGIRVTLPAGVTYNAQPDWDAPASVATGARKEVAYLELQEHEVSAFEDQSLADPALGGLETARRLRIRQRILRVNTAATKCADAWTALVNSWKAAGREFDPKTKQLRSTATLQVTVGMPAATTNACDPPTVRSGYLGAENQLIRVAIKDSGTLVWAYDNGSTIYRVDASATGFVLANEPVDDMHRPRDGQIAEICRSETLPNGERFAESTGTFIDVRSYDPDWRTLAFKQPIPAGLGTLFFVRIWDAEAALTANEATLGTTGITVTITNPNNAAGDFWSFAVRPGQPYVYPKRYETPQRPEGPRTWVCSLAVLDWTAAGAGTVLEDCRETFESLVALTKRRATTCCTVTISPDDLVEESLQTIVDQALTREHFKLCFLPGEYVLTQPLTITDEHKDVTLEACGSGVTITAAPDTDLAALGMVRLERAEAVTIRGIRFVTPIEQTKASKAGVGIGLRLIHSRGTTIEKCQFVFEIAPLDAALGVAILANGLTNGITIRDNIFVGVPHESGDVALIGVAAVPGFLARRVSIGPNLEFDPGTLFLPNIPPNVIPTVRDRFKPGDFTLQAPDQGLFVDRLPIDRIPGTGVIVPPGTTIERTVDVQSDEGVNRGELHRESTVGGGVTPPEVSFPTDPVDFERLIDGIRVTPIVTPGDIVDFGRFGNFNFFPRQFVSTGGMLPARIPLAEVTGNQFALLHAAAVFIGDLGMVRFSNNRVELSRNGVIAVSTRWIPAVSFLNSGRVGRAFTALATANAATERSSLWNGVQASSELLATMFDPRNAHVASALMSISLPAALQSDTSLIAMVGDVDDTMWPGPVAAAAHWLYGPTAQNTISLPQVDNIANLTGAIAARIAEAWGEPDPFSALIDPIVAGLGLKPIEGIMRSTTFAFECNDNTIEARHGDGSETGTALFVLDAPGEPRTSAVLGTNRLTNKSRALPAAVIAFVSRCDVTGSLVLNESTYTPTAAGQTAQIPMFWSLLLLPPVTLVRSFPDIEIVNPDNPNLATARIAAQRIGFFTRVVPPLVAVTGNVFKGWPLLPIRGLPGSVPDPMNKWVFLNTVSW